jgi:hypothetical protein
MGTGGSFSGDKGPGLKLATHLHLVPRPRMVELYFRSSYVFMAWCLIKYRKSFTFAFTLKAETREIRFI